jgi:hypothetical protein
MSVLENEQLTWNFVWDQRVRRRTDGKLVWDQRVRRRTDGFDEEVRGPTAEPNKQDRAPIKMVGGRAWSPGIYRALRLLGKSLDVAWERAFIHPLTFN